MTFRLARTKYVDGVLRRLLVRCFLATTQSTLALMVGGICARAQEIAPEAAATSLPLIAQAAVSTSSSRQEPSAAPVAPQNPTEEGPLASPSPHVPSLEELDQLFKQTSLGKAADETRLHAQWRALSNRTVNDPELVAARAHAEAAPTDLEKRQRLRAYYTMYFDRMRAKADSEELKTYLDQKKAVHLNLLAQNRVRPSPSVAATPEPQRKPPGKKAPEPPLPQ